MRLTKPFVLGVGIAAMGVVSTANAADGTWTNGGADNNWQTNANWSASPFPGDNTDVYSTTQAATFSTAGSGTINLGNLINIRNITFGIGVGSASSFVIGDADDTLNLSNAATPGTSGITLMNSGVVNTEQIGSVGTTIKLSTTAASQYWFSNQSIKDAAKLNIAGNVTTAAASGISVLTLTGSNGGTVSGVISNGATATMGITKTGGGTWTLTGNNTSTGVVTSNGGRLVLDYGNQAAGAVSNYALGPTAGVTLGNSSPSGVLEFKGKSGAGNTTTQTIGAFISGGGTATNNTGLQTVFLNKNGGDALTVSAGALTRNGGTILLVDQSGGGVLRTSTAATNGLIATQALIKDSTGKVDFLSNSGVNTDSVGVNSTTDLVTSASDPIVNYRLNGSLTLAAAETVRSVRINSTGSGQSLDLGALNLGSTGFLFVGSDDYTISGTGNISSNTAGNAGAAVENFGSGKLTVTAKIGAGTGSSQIAGNGTSLIDWNSTSNLTPTAGTNGTTTAANVTLRLSNSGAINHTNTAGNAIGTGYFIMGTNTVLELASADLTRNLASVGTGGAINMGGTSAGFSAFGADRVVAFGGTGSPTALTWGTTAGFLQNGATLIVGSVFSDKTLDFRNAIDLNGQVRTIEARAGVDATIDGTLSGVLSGSGGILKTGTGTLALTNTNTYTGTTTVRAGTLITGSISGSLGTGNVVLEDVAGVTLTLQNTASIGDTATLTFAPTNPVINMGFIGTEIVADITNGTQSVLTGLGVGTYTAQQLNDFFPGAVLNFVDTGTLGDAFFQVVPEPGTFATLLGGIGMLGTYRGRRRA